MNVTSISSYKVNSNIISNSKNHNNLNQNNSRRDVVTFKLNADRAAEADILKINKIHQKFQTFYQIRRKRRIKYNKKTQYPQKA